MIIRPILIDMMNLVSYWYFISPKFFPNDTMFWPIAIVAENKAVSGILQDITWFGFCFSALPVWIFFFNSFFETWPPFFYAERILGDSLHSQANFSFSFFRMPMPHFGQTHFCTCFFRRNLTYMGEANLSSGFFGNLGSL